MPKRIRWAQFEELIAEPSDECILWPFACSNGYPAAHYPGDPSGRVTYLHSEVCRRRLGERPAGSRYEAAHACGVKRCINADHLRWATNAENHTDMLGLGEMPLGQQRWNTVLNEDQVREIRRLRATGLPLRAVGDQFGISIQAVSNIVHRRYWKHVE